MKTFKLTVGTLAAVAVVAISAFAAVTKQPGDTAAAKEKTVVPVWLTDYAAAKQQAAAEHKSLLLDFTGSDWCGWCMKLDREIFSTPEFRDYAAKKLILVRVDFPRAQIQSAAEQAQNQKLLAQFSVQGFPTLVVLDSAQHELGELGYMDGGPKPFITKLTGLVGN